MRLREDGHARILLHALLRLQYRECKSSSSPGTPHSLHPALGSSAALY